MRVILDYSLFLDGSRLYATMTKEVETDLVPLIGMKVEDSGLQSYGITISDVTCNFQEGYYHASLGSLKLPTREACDETAEMMKEHGWKSVRDQTREP